MARVRLGEMVTVEAGNSKVSAQMEDIEGAEGSTHLDDVEVRGLRDEEGQGLDLAMLIKNPEIGAAGGVDRLSRDEMGPAGRVITRAECGQVRGRVQAALGVVEDVHGDGFELVKSVLRVFVIGQATGQLPQHWFIEGEVGVEAGAGSERGHALQHQGVFWLAPLSVAGKWCKAKD